MAVLLTTKTYPPLARLEGRVVARPRLLGRLDEALAPGGRLILVSAPAGYGKTTLVTGWAANHRAAWLSLDEQDNDPGRFLAYLVAALEAAGVSLGPAVRELLAGGPPLSPGRLDEAVAAIAASLAAALDPSPGQEPLILVLDDVHRLQSPALHGAIQFLLDHLPAALRLAIITREDPPLSLPRLRAAGHVAEIRAADLRFSTEEADQFFRQALGLSLAAPVVTALAARTEGWVVGLQLAGLSIRGQDALQIERFVRAFGGSHHYVIDYLTSEVIGRQTSEVRQFLEQTSVLDRFCASLCDALTGREDGQAVLGLLERANLFLVPLDDERHWYRYHPLFAGSVRAGLPAPQAADLHRRAALWFAAAGLFEEAVGHALATADLDLAADLIEQAVYQDSAWSRGDLALFVRWLQALPPRTLRARPRLSLYASRALYIAGQFETANALLEQVSPGLDAPLAADPETRTLFGTAATYRALYATEQGDVTHALELVGQARATLPAEDRVSRARATHAEALAHDAAGQVVQAVHAYRQAVAEYAAPGYHFGALAAAGHLTVALIARGHLRQARDNCCQVLQMAQEGGQPVIATGVARIALAAVYYEQNLLAPAAACLDQGLPQARRARIVEALRQGCLYLARVRQAQGDRAAALAALQEAEDITHGLHAPRLAAQVAAYRVRLALAQGELGSAGRWAHAYQAERATGGAVEYTRELEDVTLARVFLAQRRPDEALTVLDASLPRAEETGRLASVIDIQALRAIALDALGTPAAAREALLQALVLAEPEGYVRRFLDLGIPLVRLLQHFSATGELPVLAATLLAAYHAGHPAFPVPEPLTAREVEILRLMAAGLSNQDMAAELTLALSTVKWHLSTVYGKLGVRSRTQALSRARELGLLP